MNAEPVQPPSEVDVLVAGARGETQRATLIDAIAEATDGREAHVQAFDPASVYGARHLEAAARRAVRSHREDRAIARNLPVEIACYAAGDDQISEALEVVGVPETAEEIALCAIGPDRQAAIEQLVETAELARDDAIVRERDAALDRLGIAETSRNAVDDPGLLVVEHVALLDARRG